jgi:hypothetical protein
MQFLYGYAGSTWLRVAPLAALLATLAACTTPPIEKSNPAPSTEAPILDTSEERSACIGATAKFETCTYSIAVFGPEIAPKVIVSRKLSEMSTDGQPVWEEQDRLPAPALVPGGSLELSSCRLHGVADDTVVALLPPHDENAPDHIAAAGWAYRVELPSGRFQVLDAAAVDCVNNTIGAE